MTNENYFLSRISPKLDLSYKQIMALGDLNPYGQHQALWRLFDLPKQEMKEKAYFLFRFEINKQNKLPLFYVISCKQPPHDREGIWDIESKRYDPDILEGDRFAFKLRVNPVQVGKKERQGEEIDMWNSSRKQFGFKEKETTKKRIRHDVVMDAKTKLKKSVVPREKWPHMNEIIHNAGINWLKKRSSKNGFVFSDGDDSCEVRADGYLVNQFIRNKKYVRFSSLDFTGTLTVKDPATFKEILFNGLGPAKAFGCGLMLVRRVA